MIADKHPASMAKLDLLASPNPVLWKVLWPTCVSQWVQWRATANESTGYRMRGNLGEELYNTNKKGYKKSSVVYLDPVPFFFSPCFLDANQHKHLGSLISCGHSFFKKRNPVSCMVSHHFLCPFSCDQAYSLEFEKSCNLCLSVTDQSSSW